MTQRTTDKQVQIDKIKKILAKKKAVGKALLRLKKQKEFVNIIKK